MSATQNGCDQEAERKLVMCARERSKLSLWKIAASVGAAGLAGYTSAAIFEADKPEKKAEYAIDMVAIYGALLAGKYFTVKRICG